MMDTPQTDDPGDELVVVGRYYAVIDAEMARSQLEAEGIHAFVCDRDGDLAEIRFSFDSGWARLMVEKVDAQRALEILGLPSVTDEELSEAAGDIEEITCPECGSKGATQVYCPRTGISGLEWARFHARYIRPVQKTAPMKLISGYWQFYCSSCKHFWLLKKTNDGSE
jgi:hypothetical protein